MNDIVKITVNYLTNDILSVVNEGIVNISNKIQLSTEEKYMVWHLRSSLIDEIKYNLYKFKETNWPCSYDKFKEMNYFTEFYEIFLKEVKKIELKHGFQFKRKELFNKILDNDIIIRFLFEKIEKELYEMVVEKSLSDVTNKYNEVFIKKLDIFFQFYVKTNIEKCFFNEYYNKNEKLFNQIKDTMKNNQNGFDDFISIISVPAVILLRNQSGYGSFCFFHDFFRILNYNIDYTFKSIEDLLVLFVNLIFNKIEDELPFKKYIDNLNLQINKYDKVINVINSKSHVWSELLNKAIEDSLLRDDLKVDLK